MTSSTVVLIGVSLVFVCSFVFDPVVLACVLGILSLTYVRVCVCACDFMTLGTLQRVVCIYPLSYGNEPYRTEIINVKGRHCNPICLELTGWYLGTDHQVSRELTSEQNTSRQITSPYSCYMLQLLQDALWKWSQWSPVDKGNIPLDKTRETKQVCNRWPKYKNII